MNRQFDKTFDEIQHMNGKNKAGTASPITPIPMRPSRTTSAPRKYSDKHFPSTNDPEADQDLDSGDEETSPMRVNRDGDAHGQYGRNVQMTNMNNVQPQQFHYLKSQTGTNTKSPSEVGDLISQIHAHHAHNEVGPVNSDDETEIVVMSANTAPPSRSVTRPPTAKAKNTTKEFAKHKSKSRTKLSRQFSKTATSEHLSTSSEESDESDSSEYTTATEVTQTTAMTGYTLASADQADNNEHNYKKTGKVKKQRSNKLAPTHTTFVPQTEPHSPKMLGEMIDLGKLDSHDSNSKLSLEDNASGQSGPPKPILTDNESWNAKMLQLKAMQQQLYGNQAIPPGPGQIAAMNNMIRMQQNNTVNIQFNGNVILPQIAVTPTQATQQIQGGQKPFNGLQPIQSGVQQKQQRGFGSNLYHQPHGGKMKFPHMKNNNQLSVSPPATPPYVSTRIISLGGRRHNNNLQSATEISQLSELTKSYGNKLGVEDSALEEMTEKTEMTATEMTATGMTGTEMTQTEMTEMETDDDSDSSTEYSDDDVIGDLQTPMGTMEKLGDDMKGISAASAFSTESQGPYQYHGTHLNAKSITELDESQIENSFNDNAQAKSFEE